MKPVFVLLLAALLTACASSSSDGDYKKAIQEAMDRHWASCQLQPNPACVSVGPVKVTRVYGTEVYDNAVPKRFSEAVVIRFDATNGSGQQDSGNATIGKENGHWTVYAATSAHYESFNFDPSR